MPKMSKQSAIILILVVFASALVALIWFYFNFNSTPKVAIIPNQNNMDVYDPFGVRTTGDNTNLASTTEPILDTPAITLLSGDKLRQISEEPVSGYVVRENSQTKKTDIHYILRSNGHIYETYTDSPEARRLSITTIPKVYESVWLADGERLIIRYLKDISENIQTFSVKINPATTTLNEFEGGVDGNHLPENVSGVVVSPKGDKMFYLVDNLNGATGYTAGLNDLNKKIIFQSPVLEWLVSWPKENIITLTTKPSAKVLGYLYFLNSQTGNFSHIIGGVNGLTTKTNSLATEVLYSDSTRGAPKLYLFDVKTGESRLLPWNTFPEKCAWSNTDDKIIYCAVPKSVPEGNYPDIWYQGLINFTDDIWMLNTTTLASTLVFDIQSETSNSMDIADLSLDKGDNFLFFTDKISLTLWSLKLK
jgi:hypothetical protein